MRLLNQPNDVANLRVLKFDRAKFLTHWAARASKFQVAHFIAVSPKGEIFVADSVNGAMQKFVKRLRRTA
jgi:NHL repeat-containing protein